MGQGRRRFVGLVGEPAEGLGPPVVGHLRMVFGEVPVEGVCQSASLHRAYAHYPYAFTTGSGDDVPWPGRLVVSLHAARGVQQVGHGLHCPGGWVGFNGLDDRVGNADPGDTPRPDAAVGPQAFEGRAHRFNEEAA